MHEYTFVTVAILRRRDGTELERDYQEVIRDHARQGWNFVQAIPFESAGGSAGESPSKPRLDLVFRRKVSK